MNQYNRRQQILVVVVVIVLFLSLVTIYGNAGADGPGNSTEPLPTHAEPKACNNPGNGPVKKCPKPEVTQEPTAVSTEVKVQPTAVPTKVKIQPTPVLSVEPSAIPKVTATPVLTACDTEVCNPCEFLEDALAQGMMVIIIDRDKVEVYEDMSLRIPGQFDLLATGLLSQSGYGD